MKKRSSVAIGLLFMLGLFLAIVPSQVQAKSFDPTPTTAAVLTIAGGSWTTGSEVDITTITASVPTWLQLLSTNGVKVNESSKICHPMRGGQFGWIGEIRQFKNDQWVKLPTSSGWIPNNEGEFMACAQAPSAGIYALFGYWKRPAGYIETSEAVEVPGFICSTMTWSDLKSSIDTSIIFGGKVFNVPVGTTITWRITASNINSLVGQTGTYQTTDSLGSFWGNSGLSGVGVSSWSVIFTESTHNCSSTQQDFLS